MHRLAERFSYGDWRVIVWDEGAAAYHCRRGGTHALDSLTAEVLRHGGSVDRFDAADLARLIAQDLDLPCDQALHSAVAQSLQRLCDLATE